ncbi:MAG: YbaB/EbfC family nucleoid-associated protein [Proteobacteria bacterium]|nr:YbaB/EbfC family nucleoid-associated protein [Pseudomonadota bacterium]
MFDDIFKKAKEFKEKLDEMQKELENETFETVVGGGLIKIKSNGKGEVLSVDIDESILAPDKKELLNGLLVSGLQSAQEKVRQIAEEKMKDLKINLPGFPFGYEHN